MPLVAVAALCYAALFMRRRCLALLLLALSGCVGLGGTPTSHRPRHSGYSLWYDGGTWHLRAAVESRAHRFQGSLAGSQGGITGLWPSNRELNDQVALVGDAIQFDFEARPGEAPKGFDAQVAAGGCARFDLFVDGKHRPEWLWMGGKGNGHPRIPFERCP